MDGPIDHPEDDAPLFKRPPFGTSHAAGLQAAKKTPSRRERIIEILRETGGAALFEVVARMGVADHVISGRFTEMTRDREIELVGACRRHPKSGCLCEVYKARD